MKRITFGIDSPKDLLAKLEFDSKNFESEIQPYDVFNFFITASVLYEWVTKHYPNSEFVTHLVAAVKNEKALEIPEVALEWITDSKCIPNDARDYRFDIVNILNACWYTANASKHYHWYKSNPVKSVEEEPQVKDYYQYFFTSVEPSLYLEINKQYYNLKQIKGIAIQFYSGLIHYLESN
jgi:hypothetical protein